MSSTNKREKKYWSVNDKYRVRKDVINTLLETIKDIRIKRPVPLSSFETVIKDMSTIGIKIEIYREFKNPKVYTIGNTTSDHLGNYMLLDGSKEPHIVHIPSFNGFLSPRYGIQGNSLDIINWRSTTVFNLSLVF